MDLKEHYNQMWENALSRFQKNEFELDEILQSGEDKRFGVTLRARPSGKVENNIQDFLKVIAELEPEQYYYPQPDMHITVLTIISGHPGFALSAIGTDKYFSIIEAVTQESKSFAIDFTGITASPSCIMVQGFPDDSSLQDIRNKLRNGFQISGLQQSIDKRYAIQTAHSTVIRFKNPVKNSEILIKKLQEFREYSFGKAQITELEFVYNNWYHQQEQVKLLQKFKLK